MSTAFIGLDDIAISLRVRMLDGTPGMYLTAVFATHPYVWVSFRKTGPFRASSISSQRWESHKISPKHLTFRFQPMPSVPKVEAQ